MTFEGAAVYRLNDLSITITPWFEGRVLIRVFNATIGTYKRLKDIKLEAVHYDPVTRVISFYNISEQESKGIIKSIYQKTPRKLITATKVPKKSSERVFSRILAALIA